MADVIVIGRLKSLPMDQVTTWRAVAAHGAAGKQRSVSERGCHRRDEQDRRADRQPRPADRKAPADGLLPCDYACHKRLPRVEPPLAAQVPGQRYIFHSTGPARIRETGLTTGQSVRAGRPRCVAKTLTLCGSGRASGPRAKARALVLVERRRVRGASGGMLLEPDGVPGRRGGRPGVERHHFVLVEV